MREKDFGRNVITFGSLIATIIDRWLDQLMKLLDQVAQIECYFAKCAHVASRAICDHHEDGAGAGAGAGTGVGCAVGVGKE